MAFKAEVETPQPAAPQPAGKWVQVVATGYSPWDSKDKSAGFQDGRTSTLVDTARRPYGLAVDPKVIPYGSLVYIPADSGYMPSRTDRVFIADDTGGVIKSRTRRTGTIHVDLRYKTEHSAIRYGKRTIWVYIYDRN